MREILHPIVSAQSIPKEIEQEYPYDAIILLCGGVHRKRAKNDPRGFKLHWGKYNWRFPFRIRKAIGGQRTGDWTGNFETELKVTAAVQAYDEKLAPLIISTGGPMWGAPPLGKIMKDELTEKYHIDPGNIIEEKEAIDTGIQMKNILDIVREHGFQKVAIIADSVHLPVAARLLENWAEHESVPLEVKGLTMEDLLIQKNPRYKGVIDRMHRSRYWGWWAFKYGKLVKALEKDPLLSSFSAKVSARLIERMRTKSPFNRIRLPGTT